MRMSGCRPYAFEKCDHSPYGCIAHAPHAPRQERPPVTCFGVDTPGVPSFVQSCEGAINTRHIFSHVTRLLQRTRASRHIRAQ